MPRWRDVFVPGVLVALALALRLYRLPDYTVFQGDQGIDALAARRLVLDGVLPFEGPATSAGGVHLGPFYYYLLALPMALFGADPVVEAVLVAVLGAASVGVLYALGAAHGKHWQGALVALLYALSPAAIVASRSAWNPAPAPFFLLLALLTFQRWPIVAGLALACLIQLHYFTLGVVIVGLAVIAWQRSRAALLGLLAFAVVLSPFVGHELLSGLPNAQAALGLAAAPGLAGESVPRRLYAVFVPSLVGRFLTAGIEPLAILAAVLVVAGAARVRLVGLMLAVTLLLVVLYRGPIFEHYLVPLAPLVFVALLGLPVRLAIGVALPLVALSVWLSPLRDPPLEHLARTQHVAEAIAQRTGDAPFALLLISAGDSDNAYRYQLERLDSRATRADEALPAHLFVLCQDVACDPHAAAGPDWASSTAIWQTTIDGVSVHELVRPSSSPPRPE